MHYKYFLFVLILLAIIKIKHAELVTTALTTIGVISSVVTIYLTAEKTFKPDNTTNEMNEKISKLTETITNKIDKLNLQLNNIEEYFKNYLFIKEYSEQYDQINERIDRIDFLYKESQKWIKNFETNRTWNLKKKIDQMISLDRDYPQSVLFEISRKFISMRRRPKPNFLDMYYNVISKVTNCDEDLSPHYKLFLFYKKLIYTEVKGFAAMSVGYLWKNEMNNSEYEMNEVKNKRITNIIKYTKLFQDKMKISKNYIRRCHAKENENIEDNKTYASFENMFYTTVIDMKYLNLYPNIKSDDVQDKFLLCQRNNSCYNVNYDFTCPGYLLNCKKVKNIEYCRRKNEDKSTKNYYWIKVTELFTNDVKNLGNIDYPCQSNKLFYETFGGSPYNRKVTTYHPTYCDCIDDNINTKSNSIRTFSLLWSQTSENMLSIVVQIATGARIVAKHRMIHIQLREAKLLPYGKIDKKTERWIPIPQFIYYNNFPDVALFENGTIYKLTEYKDFVRIHHQYAKAICLQKIIFNGDYLLAGIRFDYEYLGKGLEKYIKLEAKYVGFNYNNGNITTKNLHKSQSCRDVSEFKLNKPDDPLKFKDNLYDSEENKFITIKASDSIKDASQTTIPFFDLLEIAPEMSIPISGIELFHKGQSDGTSGGYISLKIYQLNLTMYMNIPSYLDMSNIENITMFQLSDQT